jgi:type IV secretion system protein TrbL
VGLTGSFVDRLGEALHDPMLILFSALAMLWAVVSGTKLHFNMTTYKKIFEDFVYIRITGLLLGSQGAGLIAYVYTSAIDIMGAASAAVFSLASQEQSTGYSGLVALAAAGERAVAKVIQAAAAITTSGTMFSNILNFVYAAILVFPYLLLVIVFASQVVVAIFRATMVGVFAPFLFMAFAFGWGRGMATTGAKTLLASILVLFANTAALSLTVFGVNASVLEPANLVGDRLNEFASLTNPEFLVVMALGWMGTALMTEGTSIANSIAGTALTNVAAGIMTGGVATSGLTAASATKGMALWGARKLAPPIVTAAAELVEKFKNANKPGGGSGGPGAA